MSAAEDLAHELARRHEYPDQRLPCQTGNPERFFEGTPDELLTAAKECRPCGIREMCGAAADETDDRWGVWGGTVRDRQALRLINKRSKKAS